MTSYAKMMSNYIHVIHVIHCIYTYIHLLSMLSKEVSERTSGLWKRARQGDCSATGKEGKAKEKEEGVRDSSAGVDL